MKTFTQQRINRYSSNNHFSVSNLYSLTVRDNNLYFADFLHFLNTYFYLNSLPTTQIVKIFNLIGFESLSMRYSRISIAETEFGEKVRPEYLNENTLLSSDITHPIHHSRFFSQNLDVINIKKFDDGYYYYEINSPNQEIANLLSAYGTLNIGGTLLKITNQAIENVIQNIVITKEDYLQSLIKTYQEAPIDTLTHFKRSRVANIGHLYNFHSIPNFNPTFEIESPGTMEMTSIANFIWGGLIINSIGTTGAIKWGAPGTNNPTQSFTRSGEANDGRLKILGYLDFQQYFVPDSNTIVEVAMRIKGHALQRRLAGAWYDSANNATIILSGSCNGNSVQGYVPNGNSNTNITANFTFGLYQVKTGATSEYYLPPAIHFAVNSRQGKFFVNGDFVYLGNGNLNVGANWNNKSASVSIPI